MNNHRINFKFKILIFVTNSHLHIKAFFRISEVFAECNIIDAI